MKNINILCCYYVHGMEGSRRDFLLLKEKVEETFNLLFKNSGNNDNYNFHYGYCSNDNSLLKTHSEYKLLIKRSFKELNKFLEKKVLIHFKNENEEKFNKFENTQCNLYFSIIGHSLGGLISRGVIKQIYSSYKNENVIYENYFDYLKSKFPFVTAIKPCSFMTLASPHLGSRANNESGGLYKNFEKTAYRVYCSQFLLSGNIGKIFIYQDNQENDEKPVLIQLSQKEYMDACGKFPNRTLISCVRHDLPVRFCSTIGNLDHPINQFAEEHILLEDGINDTKICSYSGYEESNLDYYQKEVFNEKVSKNMFYKNTKLLPPPNIDEQIKTALNKINNKNINSDSNYDEMENIFIPDSINQVEVAVSAYKLFNQIPFRRIALDFVLPKLYRWATHAVFIGNIIIPTNDTINKMISKSITLFSNLLLADYLLTSEQNDYYSLNDIFKDIEE